MSFGAQLAHAVACAHPLGVIHCDITPSKLLVTDPDNAVLSGFGSASFVDAPGSSEPPEASWPFAAPEVLDGAALAPEGYKMLVEILVRGKWEVLVDCLLYTSDAADDPLCVDLGGRSIIKKKQNKKIRYPFVSGHNLISASIH